MKELNKYELKLLKKLLGKHIGDYQKESNYTVERLTKLFELETKLIDKIKEDFK